MGVVRSLSRIKPLAEPFHRQLGSLSAIYNSVYKMAKGGQDTNPGPEREGPSPTGPRRPSVSNHNTHTGVKPGTDKAQAVQFII